MGAFSDPRVVVVSLGVALAACAASAQFHSKTGRTYATLTERAVRVDEAEAKAVVAAGGEVIGTISARALSVRADDEDLADKAAEVAGDSGGTHVVLTEKGVEYFTAQTPGRSDAQCAGTDTTVDCTSTYTAPGSTTYEKPTAKFIVFRVPGQNWAQLPQSLRPLAAR